MHVRIAWEIYKHQQKQQQQQQQQQPGVGPDPGVMPSHKGPPTMSAGPSLSSAAKGDMLRAPNHHLYSAMPRPHDLASFPSALLGAAAAAAAGGTRRAPLLKDLGLISDAFQAWKVFLLIALTLAT